MIVKQGSAHPIVLTPDTRAGLSSRFHPARTRAISFMLRSQVVLANTRFIYPAEGRAAELSLIALSERCDACTPCAASRRSDPERPRSARYHCWEWWLLRNCRLRLSATGTCSQPSTWLMRTGMCGKRKGSALGDSPIRTLLRV